MGRQHVMVLDAGTTSTRAVLFDERSQVVSSSMLPLGIVSHPDGRVEQDAVEIWEHSRDVIREVLEYAGEHELPVVALGIATQRTTTLVWDAQTGEPVAPAISWQDTRAGGRVDELTEAWGERSKQTTGLVLGAANIALHVDWLLSRDDRLRAAADQGRLRVGTPDAWLIWNLTGGARADAAAFATSTSCAGSAGPFDIGRREWWGELLEELRLPRSLFPEVLDEDAAFGTTWAEEVGAALPITGVLGDQQASLYGQGGFEAGTAKCTHGTGSFIDFNIGTTPVIPNEGLECRIAWTTGGVTTYMVEGGAFVTGSGVDWMVDKLGVLDEAAQLDSEYAAGDPESGLVSVPALAGFAAPYWDSAARGMMIGFHRGTTSSDVVRATVDGIAHTVVDVVEAMAGPSGTAPTLLWTDGGLSRSNALMQAQADLLGASVVRSADSEFTTARGAAWCAGIAAGLWADQASALATKQEGLIFEPRLTESEREAKRAAWSDAVQRTLGWRRTPLAA